MRKLIVLAAAFIGLSATPASAQSLDGLLTLLNGGTATVTNHHYDGCDFTRGLARKLCKIRSVTNLTRDASNTVRNYRQLERNRVSQIDLNDRRPDVTVQLGERCRAGDDDACATLTAWKRASDNYEKTQRQQRGGGSLVIADRAPGARSAVPAAIRDLCMRGDQTACQTAYDIGRR